MVRAKSGAEKPVTGLGHKLSARSLRGEAVSALEVLLDLLAKVLLNDRDLAVGHARIVRSLNFLQVLGQDRQRVILRVGYEECQVDKVVRVGEVAHVREEHGEMALSVTERYAHENALFTFPAAGCALYICKIVVSYGLEVVVGVGEEAKGKA